MSMQPIEDIHHNFYGDEVRWFIGIVEDIMDPLKQGRVRVRVIGVHTPDKQLVPTKDLPWATVMAPITHSGTTGLWGTPVGVKPAAQVFGIMLDGKHSQNPLVLGTIPKIDQPPPQGGQNTKREFSKPPGTTAGSAPTSQTPATGVATPVVGNTYQEKTFNYLEKQFRDAGYKNSEEMAAGFVGNLMVESVNYQESVINGSRKGDGDTAWGIAQWRFDRADGLEKFAADQPGVTYFPAVTGAGVTRRMPDFDTQLKYIWHELQTTESGAMAKISKATTASEAAALIDQYYERSSGLHRSERQANAEAIYEKYKAGVG